MSIHRYLACLVVGVPILLSAVGQGRSVQAGGGILNSLDAVQPLVNTDSAVINQAQQVALAALAKDYTGETHVASLEDYDRPWLRDSYAWGVIPSLQGGSLDAYATTELEYWLQRQQTFGGWLTAPLSGYYDETAILLGAVLDAYRVSGNRTLAIGALGRLERGWRWLARSYIRPAKGSTYLIYANVPPHVAADWVDQVARHGYATQLEALWYRGTLALSQLEATAGQEARAWYYRAFAAGIKRDINRLLWTTAAPVAINAPAVAGFGHYRSWLGGRDYFELDSNYLCIVYGIASRAQARSINHFVVSRGGYLLRLSSPDGVPAKVVYGDYARADYAARHGRLGPDLYQSAYWPSVGALVAIGMTLIGDVVDARKVMLRLAAAFVRDLEIYEWYTPDGSGHGAPTFAWAARMFLVAVYESYLGIAPASDSGTDGQEVRLVRPDGSGSATFSYYGRTVLLSIQGSGSRPSLQGGEARLRTSLIPASLLCTGCAIHAVWAN